jgi:hypothetical protein
MVRHLTNDELRKRNVVHIKSRREFDLAIAESHGPPETEVDFPVDDLSPEYEDFDPDNFEIGSSDDPDPEDTELVQPDRGQPFPFTHK